MRLSPASARVLCLICASLLGVVRPAWGQFGSRLSLKWSAPAGCPSHDDVQARVDALLGDASAASVSDVQATGQVQRLSSGFRLELSMAAAGRPSSRVIDAGNCDELAGAAAIAITLLARSSPSDPPSATDPSVDGPSAQSTPPPGGEASPSVSQNDQSAPRANTEARAKPDVVERDNLGRDGTVHLVLDAPLGWGGWGSLPDMGLGFGAAAGARWRALRAVAGAEWWQPKSTTNQGFSTRFRLQSAHAEACLSQAFAGAELGACVGAAVERLVAQGIGSDIYAAKSSSSVWLSGTAGILVTLPVPGVSSLHVLGQAAVRVPTTRPRFVIDQLGLVHQPALAAPTLSLGCEWIL